MDLVYSFKSLRLAIRKALSNMETEFQSQDSFSLYKKNVTVRLYLFSRFLFSMKLEIFKGKATLKELL